MCIQFFLKLMTLIQERLSFFQCELSELISNKNGGCFKNVLLLVDLFLRVLVIKSLYFAFTVNGGYSQWSKFGTCSKTCGAGTQIRKRSCINNRLDCSGPASSARLCKVKECPGIFYFLSLSLRYNANVTCLNYFNF